jgi:hypothetical protein
MNDNIEKEKQLSFRRRYVHLFQAAMTMIWNMHNTPEFKKFLTDTRSYRISECMKCAEHGNSWTRRDMRLLANHPVTYVYLHNWKKMLRKELKDNTTSLLKFLGLYDTIYNHFKQHST